MSIFFIDPEGNLFSSDRVGGVKAATTGFVILGTGDDEVLSYIETPPEVALVWREALNPVLIQGYRGRRSQGIDWWGLAAAVDPEWTAKQGYEPDQSVTNGPTAAQPIRRRPTGGNIDNL